jgi:hypothetical protein
MRVKGEYQVDQQLAHEIHQDQQSQQRIGNAVQILEDDKQ